MAAKDFIVKTVWEGKVGVPDKIVYDARNYGEDLIIFLRSTRERMRIKHGSLTASIVGTSGRKYRDKYGGRPYFLLYFYWCPEAVQGVMLE